MARLKLKYGKESVPCDLSGASVLAPRLPDTGGRPEQLIDEALDRPIASQRLEEIVRPGDKVAVVVSDITRYTGSEYYLPQLAARLKRAGVAETDIQVVIGLGIHRRQTPQEHRRILGPLHGRVEAIDHDCDDPAELAFLGTTASGMPIEINRRVVEADRVVVSGTIGFHYFAGFGGGRKALVPGVASRQTCMATHFAVFNSAKIGGKHARATTGVLEGNPVHEAILEGARMVGPDFLFNTVLAPDKTIIGAFAGDLEQAHLAGCDLVRRLYRVELEHPADLAIVSCGGHPKDINFVQAHKSLDYAVNAVRPGGTVILLAACPDGYGHPDFHKWLRYQDLSAFEEALRENYQINGQTAHATLSKARRYRVILISGFDAEQTRAMGMEKAEGLDEALEMARAGLPSRHRAVIIPDGGTVLPSVRG
ncbi:MAG: nickel-dependent lactate racemase [Desulfuromonadales bacterium]|nr:nickel-dependent lactate racemase [Desulfuromonadales bacterium]NIR33430.1 nickel-dependent lactate racemase [Desulfuromonadales bacterium]NIS42175.1 nickel-dependent lactate racemase [Desulfuromonadales bacterium]